MAYQRTTPSYVGLRAASPAASYAASRSAHSGTRCEQVLRTALGKARLRYRKNVAGMPGRPDIVLLREKIAIFCDGDFWHGKNWEQRKARLARGTNAPYWVRKIESNMLRDRRHDVALREAGWCVLRFWESEIRSELPGVVQRALIAVHERRATAGSRGGAGRSGDPI